MITRRAFINRDEATQQLVHILRNADLSFTNLESLPNDFCGYPAVESGGTHMAAQSWVIDELMAAGIDMFACATNHALDYSIEGLLAVLTNLERKAVPFAGVGRNLADARMPVYVESSSATVALLACVSTFAKGQAAGEQRPDVPGRPGVNPLHVKTTYEVTPAQCAWIRQIAEELGVEQRRQEAIESGFGYPPDDPAVFPFLGSNFREGFKPAIRTSCDKKDVEAIIQWIHEARSRSDVVLVSLHAHESGTTREDPAEFIVQFGRLAVDEGADLVVGHGPHLIRGLEVYKGKPIFYSLGNFIAQNDLVYKLPADAYDRFRTDPGATPSTVFSNRSRSEQSGFPADPRYWQSVMPVCDFVDGCLTSIELIPVALGYGQPVHRRGRPKLAEEAEGVEILGRLQRLSNSFGTRIEINDGKARVTLG